MRPVRLVLALFAFSSTAAIADDYTLASADKLPKDLPATLADQLAPQGFQVKGPKRELCSIWLLKDVAVKSDFAPSTAIKYPFTPGQLLGVISVPRRAGLTDFRGHEIESGLYTLRYGQQPMDGNHIGTSDTADFLLAVPVAEDADPAPIADLKSLFSRSAQASGTTHPAIFSLLPAEEAAAPGLTNDAEHEFWILNVAATAGEHKVPLRLIVVGKSKG
jgi:hypothetical protein